MSSLPVGYVGLVVPVLPALQRVDVCVHTGLATGHRTRHGETRGSGAVGRVARRSTGVGTADKLERGCRGSNRICCLCGCEMEKAKQLASLCSQSERNGRPGGREPEMSAGARRSLRAEQRSLAGLSEAG